MLAVVSDSSPIIYLTRLGHLSLLRRLHETGIVPHAVWLEVVVGGRGLPESASLEQAVVEGWIQVKAPQHTGGSLGGLVPALGRGEVEAILLAKELDALLLTDDSDGRAAAQLLGIKVSGTVGLLIRAKAEGHIPSLKLQLGRLRTETNFRMSDELYTSALRAGGELIP